jgi:hypothetical protein
VSHKILDEHIAEKNGSFSKFFSKIRFGEHLIHLNWHTQWHFILKKTIPFFWIPAQTVNFLLPEEYRVLFAAILSIVLGILLAIAAVMSKNK